MEPLQGVVAVAVVVLVGSDPAVRHQRCQRHSLVVAVAVAEQDSMVVQPEQVVQDLQLAVTPVGPVHHQPVAVAGRGALVVSLPSPAVRAVLAVVGGQ